MQFRLRKVTKISELVLGNQFITFNKSMETFLRKDDAMSGIPLIAIKTRPGAVDVRIGKTISTITQDTLNKYMNMLKPEKRNQFLKEIKTYINERLPYDFYYLGKNNIQKHMM